MGRDEIGYRIIQKLRDLNYWDDAEGRPLLNEFVAAAAGAVKRERLYRWIANKSRPDYRSAQTLAALLNVKVGWLMNGGPLPPSRRTPPLSGQHLRWYESQDKRRRGPVPELPANVRPLRPRPRLVRAAEP